MSIVEGRPGTELEGFTLATPPEPAYIGMTRMFAGAVARHYGCEEETIDDIKVAISEAVTNAIKAHASAGVDREVKVFAKAGDGRVTFEVVDEGRGVDEIRLSDSEGPTPVGGLFEGSLGLTLIRSLFDDAEITPNPGGGTTARFSVEIPAASA